MHCDVWAGFIFVNLAKEPEQSLRDFLGPMVTKLENYPFEKQSERWFYRATVKSNWKLYMDAFQEFYHAPVLHAKQTPPDWSIAAQQAGFEAPAYTIDGPHRLVSTAGIHPWNLAAQHAQAHGAASPGAGSSGRGTRPTSTTTRRTAGINPAGCDPWGLDSFQIFPNFVILVWGQSWYLTYHYWPTSHNTHVFEGTLYFVPAKTARERVAHEMAAVSFKEYGLQDANTLEATQTMLESRVLERFPLNDQEVLCRHLHKVAAEWVDDYKKRGARGGMTQMADDRLLPRRVLRPGAVRRQVVPADRARALRACAWPAPWTRCRRSTTPITPRADEAMTYCDRFPLDDLPEDATNLLHLLYSMVMVSFPVECWGQPRVPDTGAAYLDLLVEPGP